MNINPMQLIQLIRAGNNPQQLVMNILQNTSNPILQNALQMQQNGNQQGLQSLARNLAQQRGLDFNKEFNNFRNYFR